jgi:hypothetical protein
MVPIRRLGAPRAHIDEELESDFAQREKKASVERELWEIGVFTSVRMPKLVVIGSLFQPLGDALSYCFTCGINH